MSQFAINWDKVRHHDGTIALEEAFTEMYGQSELTEPRSRYLSDIQILSLPRSRQAAAVAIATARYCIP